MLLTGLALLPRLTLRLSLLYLPLRTGLGERWEVERRGLETDLETGLPFDRSEYGERLRARPRGDADAMVAMML